MTSSRNVANAYDHLNPLHRVVLTPTGCTKDLCQSGRLTRPLEPKLGENRSSDEMEREADRFLAEMYHAGFFKYESEFQSRRDYVCNKIREGSIQARIWVDHEGPTTGKGQLFPKSDITSDYPFLVQNSRIQVKGVSSSGYKHTKQELEWGIRVAWRNARKCIMRAHFTDLRLFDLRDVTTSKGMIESIQRYAPVAYNKGRIQPSAFVFPQRSLNGSGPMFWNKQLLGFAGYPLEDGSILGDPLNTQLTSDIMDLGWKPPQPRTPWDILPLVAMAEGDIPVMGTLPAEITQLVSITHPQYEDAFAAMNLNWYRFPALSNLGFDIGGIQYTGAPFIGWWMDAEIGIRDLADSFRYNCLPEVAKAIGWKSDDIEFDDLPDAERLLWLSKAQAELNFAVYYSFAKANVSCTSSLTASASWCAFDDEHLRTEGIRLNSDPYWISPPQGSIVPIWHRGFAPNYQPKPIITKNRYDPVKVWQRRAAQLATKMSAPLELPNRPKIAHRPSSLDTSTRGNKLHIYYAGTGATALSIAQRLHKYVKQLSKSLLLVGEFTTLNEANLRTICPRDTVLVVISTTGSGEIPSNGQKFLAAVNSMKGELLPFPIKYSIFGIGDSGYHTFNAAAETVNQMFVELNATPVDGIGISKSDVSLENPPLTAFGKWLKIIGKYLENMPDSRHQLPIDLGIPYAEHHDQLKSYNEATLNFEERSHLPGQILRLSLRFHEQKYSEMDHLRLLPRNSPANVEWVISQLGFEDGGASLTLCPPRDGRISNTTIREFLTDYVDLYGKFLNEDWIPKTASSPTHKQDSAGNSSEPSDSVLSHLKRVFRDSKPTGPTHRTAILFSMPLLKPRTYSIANSPAHHASSPKIAQVLAKITPSGRFSETCLSELGSDTKILYRITPSNLPISALTLISQPLVAVACGTGFGPLRSIIQARVHLAITSSLPHQPHLWPWDPLKNLDGPTIPKSDRMALFLGYKVNDAHHFTEVVREAVEYDLVDALCMVPSNNQKKRVQNHFAETEKVLVQRLVIDGGYLYVCGAPEMVKGVKAAMAVVLGEKAWKKLTEGGRLAEEIF